MVYTAEALECPKGTTLPGLLLKLNVNNVADDRPAMIDGISGETVYTYSSLRAAVRRVANYLRTEVKLTHGTVVGILATNSSDFPILVHGILAAGGVVSAFNPLYQGQEIAHYLHIAKPGVMLVDSSLTGILTDGLALAKLDYTPDLYALSSDTSQGQPWKSFDFGRIISTTPGSLGTPEPHPGLTTGDLAFICFSSGTTGPMKGVYLTHGNIVANIFQHRQRLPEIFENSETVAALVTPFFHILGLGVFVCQYVCQGVPIVVFPKFDIQSLLDAIPRDRSESLTIFTALIWHTHALIGDVILVTHINIVPPIALRLLQATATSTIDFSSLKCLINAAAPLKEVVSGGLSQRMGCSITQWYGMTEASPSVISQREDEVGVTGTVGKLLPGMSMKIVDSEGKEREPKQSGQLLIQGPNLTPGYVGILAAESDAAFIDGYFKTGDIGYINEKGYVFLVGRSKELIKVKGHQVAPAELESILLTHPRVRDAAVKGVYVSDHETEYPVAYVAIDPLLPDSRHLEADIEVFVNKQVAKYKWLRGGVHIIPAIPRNASGKILRHQLPEPAKGKRETRL
ncbi:4-coumarate-CoA ligase [Penicillium brasilianum]|uniref:4-coumarate-CoA ligase n=1 Tax=Penicillium brasilianum TaxID=104259 RepID=A0A1S9S0K6_PENBI|nr:4-coumarate-CoA ligase [Penicillium brasilianum]